MKARQKRQQMQFLKIKSIQLANCQAKFKIKQQGDSDALQSNSGADHRRYSQW